MNRFLRLILLVVTTSTAVQAQNALESAMWFGQNESRLLYLSREHQDWINTLPEVLEISSHPLIDEVEWVFRNLKDEALLQNTFRYVDDPFDDAVLPFSVWNVRSLIDDYEECDVYPVYPLVSPDGLVVIHPFEGVPFLDFDPDNRELSVFDSPEEMLSWVPIYGTNQVVPAETDRLFALVETGRGRLHLIGETGIDPDPSAQYSPLLKSFVSREGGGSRTPEFLSDIPDLPSMESGLLGLFRTESGNYSWLVADGLYLAPQNVCALAEAETPDEYENRGPSPFIPPPVASGPQVGLAPGATGLSTRVVDALAQFLVDRVRQELTLAFYDRFRSKVEQAPELAYLFPNTTSLLDMFDPATIPGLGDVWTVAFKEDVLNMAPNMERLLLSDSTYTEWIDHPGVKSFRLGIHAMEGAIRKESGYNVLRSLDDRFGGSTDTISRSIRLLRLLFEELVSGPYSPPERLPVSTRVLRDLGERETVYLSSQLLMRYRDFWTSFGGGRAGILVEAFEKNPSALGTTLVEYAELWETFSENRERLNYAMADPEVTDYSVPFLEHGKWVLDAISWAHGFRYFVEPDMRFQDPFYKLYYPVTQNTLKAVQASRSRSYGAVLMHTMQAIEPIFNFQIEKMENELVQLELPDAGNAAEAKRVVLVSRLRTLERIMRDVFFYGSFMVDVLSAESSAEVRQILERYALPAGSYKMKRTSRWDVSLNAYPGLYGGFEYNETLGEGTGRVFGVTAPIGLAVSRGNRILPGVAADGHSSSLFVSILDIGAAFSYRWANDAETSGFPDEITWQQILSPGMHLVWGIREFPGAVSFGVQYTPKLRSITEDLQLETAAGAWRIHVGLNIDIPMFQLYRRSN